MSIDAIHSSNISFNGETKKAEKSHRKAEKHSFTQKLAQPIKDSFHKKYGDDAEATPKLVADFAADKLIKAAVVGLGMAVVFKKMRTSTNGLTEAIKSQDKKNIKNIATTVIDTIKQNKAANAASLKESGDSILKSFKKDGCSVMDGVKGTLKSVFKTKDHFDADSKLGKLTKKTLGDKAEKVNNLFRKAGIANEKDLLDTAVAVGATAAVTKGLNEVTDDVTTSDDAKLAESSTLSQIKKKAAKLAEFGTEFEKRMSSIGE